MQTLKSPETAMTPFFKIESAVEFLAHSKQKIESHSRNKITLSELAKRGGFKSRSYVGMVLSGQKKITDKTIPSFIKMFEMKKNEEKYFITLLESERGALGSQEKLKKLQHRISKKEKREKVEFKNEELITPTTFHVYASLGIDKKIRKIDEIMEMTNLSKDVCLKELNTLVLKKWATSSDEGYVLSNDLHIIVDEKNKANFNKNWFIDESKKAQTIAANEFNNKDHLFLTYKFSIKKSNMLNLRDSLKEVLSTFAENSTHEDSDRVVSLNLSLI